MCEASNWSKIHSYICIACYLLCVIFDVHLHGVECTPSKSPSMYDERSDISRRNDKYLVVKACKSNFSFSEDSSYSKHLDKLVEMFAVSANESNMNSTMSGVRALNKFLKSIGLRKTVRKTMKNDNEHDHEHGEHDHDHDHKHEDDHYSESKSEKQSSGKEDDKSKCLTAKDYYEELKIGKSCPLGKEEFKEICPSFVYQLAEQSCVEVEDKAKKKRAYSSIEVWGCCIAAVIIISLVGLVAVALIPLMNKEFYDILVQFLIALGVGTLVGDAVLHLIPHALTPHDHSHSGGGDDKQIQDTVWKSIMAIIGIHVFFLTERLTTMIQSYRVRQRIRRRRTRLLDTQSSPSNGVDEVTVAIIQSDGRLSNGDRTNVIMKTSGRNSASSGPTDAANLEDSGFDLKKLVAGEGGEHNHSHNSLRTDCNVVAEEANRLMHQTPVHHCHSHDFSSIKAIAWTVIMGDGLHNFCDGVAIGAAFVDDLRGGLSTSIAVIWHELPHEIGDFAVLLKAGMSVKMAVFYNILSSIFCFAGMVIGITVGGMQDVTPWVFMLATGMFIYIALVDMLPNLTCDQVDENGQPTRDGTKSHRKLVFFIQNLGMLTGYAVMLLIALYEDRILS